MTLLTIAEAVADEAGVIRPTSVIGSELEEARLILRQLNKCGLKLMKAYAWQVLRAEHAFSAVSGETQTGILPNDFDRLIPETFWNRSDDCLVTGPVSPVEWQGLKVTGYSGTDRFIYRGGAFHILPAPSGGESMAFEYVSKNWCARADGTAQSSFQADSDTAIIDEELLTRGAVYEFLRSESLPWEAAWRDYMDYFDLLTGNERASVDILVAGDIFGGGRHFAGAPTTNYATVLA